jgi:hypothetical protein
VFGEELSIYTSITRQTNYHTIVAVSSFFGMAHDHLTFLQHGERNFPSGGVGGVSMPSITSKSGGSYSNENENQMKSFTEKLIDVVDFLQSLPPGQKVCLLIYQIKTLHPPLALSDSIGWY